MKRLSFASEILTDPPIIFADEPTSGLDSYLAMAVVNTLRDLAANGSTILCTIHQPSSEIFMNFDSLCLLSMVRSKMNSHDLKIVNHDRDPRSYSHFKGKCAYMGNLNDAQGFFSDAGYACKSNYNPADHYIWELSIIEGQEELCKTKINKICDYYNSSPIKKELKIEKDLKMRAHIL